MAGRGGGQGAQVDDRRRQLCVGTEAVRRGGCDGPPYALQVQAAEEVAEDAEKAEAADGKDS